MRAVLIKRIVCWALVAANMIAIFMFSAQNGDESTVTSNSVIDTVLSAVYPGYKKLDADARDEVIVRYSLLVRKLAHFSAYASLGFFTALAFGRYNIYVRKRAALSFGFCVIYALTDEIHQYFVPDRAMRLLDVGIDSAGAVFGICVLLLLGFLHKRAHKE